MEAFPSTVLSRVCALFQERISIRIPDVNTYNRMLKSSDPNYSVGVFPSVWLPQEDSYEMGHSPASEPTLQTYQIGMHILSKDSDRVRGLAMHTSLARQVRMVLYRDPVLRVGLGSLAVADEWGTESFRRGRPVNHRYLSSEIGNKTLAYLSILDYSLETEMR